MTLHEQNRFPTAIAGIMAEAQRLERSGQRESAREHYHRALYALPRAEETTASTIVRRVARSYIDEGRFDVALDCLITALTIAEAHDDIGSVAHAHNLMAIAHVLRGDLDQAEILYANAHTDAIRAQDEHLQAMIAQNRGIIASMRGDLAAALEHYASSLLTYRTAGLREYLGPVLNNMGLVYTQLGRLDEAQAAYDEAVIHCQNVGDVPHRLLAHVNSASLWLARGDIERAEALCRRVLYESTKTDDQRALAETYKHLGVIARMRGGFDLAERQLATAYDTAMQREDLLLAAETVREQAELYEQMGKNRETLQALSLSHQLFTKIRASRNLADLQLRIARLETRFFDIVGRWAQTIESKDAYTLGHCERVADYACALARDLGFDDITMFWFRIGAVLHDVGKIVVPSEVLNKPGPLTDEERAIMERHAAAGWELLRDIEFPWDVLPMVRGHHERWDGRGYPDRLAGEQIALSARIVCVADVFDALTTDRPYRRAFTREQALAMMAADNGKMFDPALFPRFERVIRATNLYRGPIEEPIALAS